MDKNHQTSSCPKAVCEKIFRAITFGPIRRISSHQQTPSPVKYVPNPTVPNADPPIIKTKLTSPVQPLKPTSKEGSEIPIKFDYTSTRRSNPQPTGHLVQSAGMRIVPGKSKPNYAERSGGKSQDQGKRAKQQYGDTFSEYINRTRKRIMSHDQDNVENGPKVVRHDHGVIGKDHHFSDYIDKTKRKIRTTSSIKDRSESFFK
ncbi:hypothetical protein PTKIN_Ptkin12aG0124700 [Pterospermum kingtungense]